MPDETIHESGDDGQRIGNTEAELSMVTNETERLSDTPLNDKLGLHYTEQNLDDMAVLIIPNHFLKETSKGLEIADKIGVSKINDSPNLHMNNNFPNQKDKNKPKPPPPRPPKKEDFKLTPEQNRHQTNQQNIIRIKTSSRKRLFKRKAKISYQPSPIIRLINYLMFKKVHFLRDPKMRFRKMVNSQTESISWRSNLSHDEINKFSWLKENANDKVIYNWDRWVDDPRLVFADLQNYPTEQRAKFKKLISGNRISQYKKVKPLNYKFLRFNNTKITKCKQQSYRSIRKYNHKSNFITAYNQKVIKLEHLTLNFDSLNTKSTGLRLYHFDQKTFDKSYKPTDLHTPYVLFIHSPTSVKKIRKMYSGVD